MIHYTSVSVNYDYMNWMISQSHSSIYIQTASVMISGKEQYITLPDARKGANAIIDHSFVRAGYGIQVVAT